MSDGGTGSLNCGSAGSITAANNRPDHIFFVVCPRFASLRAWIFTIISNSHKLTYTLFGVYFTAYLTTGTYSIRLDVFQMYFNGCRSERMPGLPVGLPVRCPLDLPICTFKVGSHLSVGFWCGQTAGSAGRQHSSWRMKWKRREMDVRCWH